MITKSKLDALAKKYETESFINNDPCQFMHKGAGVKDKELYAFIASLFAYGNRKLFINFLNDLFDRMDNSPYEFINNPDYKALKGLYYRFSKDGDIVELIRILNKLYTENGGLKELFEYSYNVDKTIYTTFVGVVDYFYSNVGKGFSQGFYHLLPDPKKGGAMKRLNMFLRWMIRKPPVDLGLWDFIPQSELLIPLDVHVARLSREMGLLTRKSNDFQAVLELTENLKNYCPEDPVKYDFAIFGLGVDG